MATQNTDILEFFQSCDNKVYTVVGILGDDPVKFVKDNGVVFNVVIVSDKNKVWFVSADDTLESEHFTKIVGEWELDKLPEMVTFIESVDIMNYCIVCHKKMEFQSDRLVSCGEDKCLYKYEELIIGNILTEKIKEDADKCRFLLESAIDAMTCARKMDIFEPFPQYFMKYEVEEMKRGSVSKLSGANCDGAKNFKMIDKTLEGFNISKYIETATTCLTDAELAEVTGKDLYVLMRFVLMSCKVDIVANDDLLGIKGDKFKVYKIIHPEDKEDEFKKISGDVKTDYLFHGSGWCNWYSILRNGLKNCSKSKLQLCGAAYGNGIYLSSTTTLSFNYGLSGDKSVIGVFELINKDSYKKTDIIYVVDDEKILIQRYLLLIPVKHRDSVLKQIDGIFNKQIHEEKLNAAVKYNKKSIARIVKEYKMLSKLKPENFSFRIELDFNYPFLWNIFIGNLKEDYLIAQDMKKYGVKEIQMEIRFENSFPFTAPFLRIVLPHFAVLTGHITSKGSVCNEILARWSPSCSIESLVVIVISEIIEGGGRLDPQKYSIPYSYEEAKIDFIRVAKSHGWM